MKIDYGKTWGGGGMGGATTTHEQKHVNGLR